MSFWRLSISKYFIVPGQRCGWQVARQAKVVRAKRGTARARVGRELVSGLTGQDLTGGYHQDNGRR